MSDVVNKQAEERSKKYGIGIKTNYGHLEKPAYLDTLTDDDFADPVHYMMPLGSENQTKVASSNFCYYEYRRTYSQEEIGIIRTRILDAMDKFRIEPRELMQFSEATVKTDSDKWIDVFKVGEHTDSAGDTQKWTQEDLNEIVDLYNNQPEEERHRAPATAGKHQDDTSLVAYGWVKALKTEDGHLYAQFEKIDTDFFNMVNEGKFNTVSIALYPNKLLQHVAFLGAIPPAVKGLVPPMFSERGNATNFSYYRTKDFSENKGTNLMEEFIQAVVKELKLKYGTEVAADALAIMTRLQPEILPAKEEDTPEPEAPETAPVKEEKKFSESEEFKALQIQVENEREAREKLQKQLQAERDAKYFSEKMNAGILLPKQIKLAENVLTVIREPKESYHFSEGSQVQTGEDAFKEFINSMPKQIEFNEFATKKTQVEIDKLDQIRKQIREGK